MIFPTVADLEAAARGEHPGITYGLHGLPTVRDLQAAIAALEGGHAAFAVPSGLTATTLPLLALLRAGDHVLVTDSVYGPTRRFCRSAPDAPRHRRRATTIRSPVPRSSASSSRTRASCSPSRRGR